MIVCGANGNAFYDRLPRESDLTLLRAISVGFAAEETRKRAPKILSFNQPATSIKQINFVNYVLMTYEKQKK